MEVLQGLHMNGGVGDTSYARNSAVQNKIISIVMPVVEEAIMDLCCTNIPESLGIADLGCASGPNTLFVASKIIDAVYGRCRHLGRSSPEFRVVLNDLPGNDFNSVFLSLPAFYNTLKEEKGNGFGPCFISGVPGSFYGRLFPRKSLHFVHSSSSLHWLSQVMSPYKINVPRSAALSSPSMTGPVIKVLSVVAGRLKTDLVIPFAKKISLWLYWLASIMVPQSLQSDASTPLNKGKIYISKTSPPCVFDAYLTQFRKDFSLFLKSRSEEIVPRGRMVLSFIGRSTEDPTTEESCHQWELLAQALRDMVLDGVVEEEKLDSFNAPYYSPCPGELKSEIEREGSFIVDRLELFELDWDGGACNKFAGEEKYCKFDNPITSSQVVAKTIRAVVESMLEAHFGGEIMDDLFRRFGEIVREHLSSKRSKYVNLVISMIRKGQD